MMSEFSPELIDYLDGKISFEEFEKRRSERKAKEKESKKVGTALIYSKTREILVRLNWLLSIEILFASQ